MDNNKRWIRNQMNQGREIVDIGIDPNRAERSAYYEMEKQTLEEAKYPVKAPRDIKSGGK